MTLQPQERRVRGDDQIQHCSDLVVVVRSRDPQLTKVPAGSNGTPESYWSRYGHRIQAVDAGDLEAADELAEVSLEEEGALERPDKLRAPALRFLLAFVDLRVVAVVVATVDVFDFDGPVEDCSRGIQEAPGDKAAVVKILTCRAVDVLERFQDVKECLGRESRQGGRRRGCRATRTVSFGTGAGVISAYSAVASWV